MMQFLAKARAHRAKTLRHRAVNELLSIVDEDKREAIAPLVPLFSDDRIDFLKKVNPNRIPLKEWIALLDSDEYKDFSLIQFIADSFVTNNPHTGLSSLIELAELMQSVQSEWDPDANLHPAANDLVPRIVLSAAKNLSYEHVELSSVEKRRLLEVAFLTQSKGEYRYIPNTRISKYNTTDLNTFTTEQILAHPDKGARTHAEEHWRNAQRLVEITELLNEDISFTPQLCTYPEEFINELAKLESDGQNKLVKSALEAVKYDEINITPEMIQESLAMVKLLNHPDMDDTHLASLVLKTMDSDYPRITTSEQRIAFMRVIIAMYRICKDHESKKYFDSDDRIADQRIVDLLIAEPEQSFAIMDMIIDRKTFDYDQFMVSIDIQTFKSGAL